MESLVVPTFALDKEGRVIIWNRACERLTGIAAAEVIGTSDHWRGYYYEPRPTLADLVLQGRTAEAGTFYTRHHALHIERGSTVGGYDALSAADWCDMPQVDRRLFLVMDAAPIYDHHGSLIGALETWRDMTAQKEVHLSLEQAAARDALTGLANRRSFDTALQKEWLRAGRESQPLSLLMVDVDNFKLYNDSYGHPAGDECLRLVAKAMASQTRAYDLVARYGGEEFTVILPNQSIEGAAATAERIRAAIEQLALPHAASAAGHVTVSIGVASITVTTASEVSQLTSAADAALYRAKNRGRYRVCLL
jgi:diguanylate cyclase (GGDEF)-like protein